jgi:hypothetical protein
MRGLGIEHEGERSDQRIEPHARPVSLRAGSGNPSG